MKPGTLVKIRLDQDYGGIYTLLYNRVTDTILQVWDLDLLIYLGYNDRFYKVLYRDQVGFIYRHVVKQLEKVEFDS